MCFVAGLPMPDDPFLLKVISSLFSPMKRFLTGFLGNVAHVLLVSRRLGFCWNMFS